MSVSSVWPTGAKNTGKKITVSCGLFPTIPSPPAIISSDLIPGTLLGSSSQQDLGATESENYSPLVLNMYVLVTVILTGIV